MSRQKLKRFADNAIRENIIEPGKELYTQMKGNWRSHFKNDNPITVEFGCGQGEYTVGLAQIFPDRNFIGVDIKGNRIWNGSTQALENNLNNVAFLRTKIQSAENFFDKGEINEVWITFPDPRPKNRDARRRLTHPRFLNIYKNILAPGGNIHLKTDDQEFMNYSLEVLESLKISPKIATYDLYKESYHLDHHHDIKTKFEKEFLAENKPINYLNFVL